MVHLFSCCLVIHACNSFWLFHLFFLVFVHFTSPRQYVVLGICYLDIHACNSFWLFQLFCLFSCILCLQGNVFLDPLILHNSFWFLKKEHVRRFNCLATDSYVGVDRLTIYRLVIATEPSLTRNRLLVVGRRNKNADSTVVEFFFFFCWLT